MAFGRAGLRIHSSRTRFAGRLNSGVSGLVMRLSVLTLLFLGACTSAANTENSWPVLPSSGFTAGRAATQADVTAGSAGFAIGNGTDVVGTPLPIAIPQYALFN